MTRIRTKFFYRCDDEDCNKEAVCIEQSLENTSGWLSVRNLADEENPAQAPLWTKHFCSFVCLSRWAAKKSGKKIVKIEIPDPNEYGKTMDTGIGIGSLGSHKDH